MPQQATYAKPNMAALEGEWGRRIYETVRDAPETDWAALRERSRSVKEKIAKAMADGTF